ncbi:LLM class flavin-dependent oxidoreductase [Streptomyces sp. NPDC096105]|uniref:LLM class flavin-dependent oxidoreductase n=1 Tax=Streptomyces sp. NPDC096105 TaxID=3366074 RepID=UPI003827826F
MQLGHRSRGRAMFGMGAGVSPADAHMRGIAAGDQRRMTAESLDALVRLLHGDEPVTVRTGWFELRDARLYLKPCTKPCSDMAVAGAGSERGMRLAGRYGLDSLTSRSLRGAS